MPTVPKSCYTRRIGLGKLDTDAIITKEERDALYIMLHVIEHYVTDGSTQICEEVSEVGDEGFVCLTDRIMAGAREKGLAEGLAEGLVEGMSKERTKMISVLLSDGHTVEEIASLLHLDIEEVQVVQDSVKA